MFKKQLRNVLSNSNGLLSWTTHGLQKWRLAHTPVTTAMTPRVRSGLPFHTILIHTCGSLCGSPLFWKLTWRTERNGIIVIFQGKGSCLPFMCAVWLFLGRDEQASIYSRFGRVMSERDGYSALPVCEPMSLLGSLTETKMGVYLTTVWVTQKWLHHLKVPPTTGDNFSECPFS